MQSIALFKKQIVQLILFVAVCTGLKAQLQQTKMPNVFGYGIKEGARDYMYESIAINDSLFLYKKTISSNDSFFIVNLKNGEVFDKFLLKDDYINAIHPLKNVVNNDELYFISHRDLSRSKKKSQVLFKYSISKKSIEPILLGKFSLPRDYQEYFRIDYKHTFVDAIKKNIYFGQWEIKNSLLVRYNITSNQFEFITLNYDFSKKEKFIYAHNDYLFFQVNEDDFHIKNKNEIVILSATDFKDPKLYKSPKYKKYKFSDFNLYPTISNKNTPEVLFQFDSACYTMNDFEMKAMPGSLCINITGKPISDFANYQEGLLVLEKGNKQKKDSLVFPFQVLGSVTVSNKIVVFLNLDSKANPNYRKDIAQEKENREKEKYEEEKRKREEKRKAEETTVTTETENPELQVTHDFSRAYNYYTTFTKTTNAGSYIKMANQLRFTFSKNKIQKYQERTKVVNIDWVFQKEYRVIKSFKAQYKGETFYEYHTDAGIEFLVNEGNPQILIIRDGTSYTQYTYN